MTDISQHLSITSDGNISDYTTLASPIFEDLRKQKVHLHITDTGVQLTCLEHAISPLSMSLIDRKKHLNAQQNSRQPLIRALGLSRKLSTEPTIRIVDLTAGFGIDSLCLALHGYSVVSIEKNPITATVLNILVHQYKSMTTTNWEVINACSHTWLNNAQIPISHAMMDPFFQKRHHALPKNDMQWLIKLNQDIETPPIDEETLFLKAKKIVTERIVVKRDRRAQPIDNQKPNAGSIQLKTTRLDIYQLAGFTR